MKLCSAVKIIPNMYRVYGDTCTVPVKCDVLTGDSDSASSDVDDAKVHRESRRSDQVYTLCTVHTSCVHISALIETSWRLCRHYNENVHGPDDRHDVYKPQ